MSTVVITAVLASSYDTTGDGNDDLFFFEWDVNMSLYAIETYITVVQDSDSWKSEPFIGDGNLTDEINNNEVRKIEYFNIDNAFQIDFSTGITYTLYIYCVQKKRSGSGESSIYDNQSEKTVLKKTKQRILRFETLPVPRYIGETIDLCFAMDNLVINGISYVFEEDAIEEIEEEGSNFINITAELTDKEYLGVNTHDIGFTCDTPTTEGEVMILTILGASGSETFTVPAGYLVHTLRSQWVSGATVEVKLGTSIGGQNLVYPRDITSVETDRTTSIHGDIDRDSDTDIYATVTGGVANLDLQIIKNTE
jgi:hypothetical protein